MYINITTIIIFILCLVYLLWTNYKYSPKRIIKNFWDEVHKNSKLIYKANETNELRIVEDLERQNKEKISTINTLLKYYFDKQSKYYHYNYDTDIEVKNK